MKLRWKFFFILLVFGLVPLGVVTVASQRGIRWIGTVIAADVQQNSARLANSILKRTAENSATLLELNKKSFELALSRLVFEADAVLTEKPQGRRKVYPAADFDDPVATPRDAGLRPGYIKKLADGRSVNEVVSFEHPSVLFAPGVSPSKVVDDVDRLSLLTDTFAEIFAKLGHALHWIYVSSESGVHLSFPGHGGYPKGYDPRRFSWYLNATEEPRW
ncbi:MAG TPA: hypothetical protein VLU73_10700, partial [Methylococcaceae bacterium]|nr:hypothetical protein [Methylococcaceae bacterium]